MKLVQITTYVAAVGAGILLHATYDKNTNIDVDAQRVSQSTDDSIKLTVLPNNTDTLLNESIATRTTTDESHMRNDTSVADEWISSLEDKEEQLGVHASTAINDLLFDLNIDTLMTSQGDQRLTEFNEWVNSVENPAKQILEYMNSDLDEDSLHVLQYMVAMSGSEILVEDIVNQMTTASESDYAAWEQIMNVTTVSTKSARDSLLETLPAISDPSLVSASIRAIQPGMIPVGDRTQVLSQMATYATTGDEQVRVAAIESMGYWAAHDYTHIIASELSQGTEATKGAAIQAAGSANMLTGDIKIGLTQITQDSDAPISLRLDAYSVLTRFPMSDNEYEQQYQFYLEYVKPLETLANQG